MLSNAPLSIRIVLPTPSSSARTDGWQTALVEASVRTEVSSLCDELGIPRDVEVRAETAAVPEGALPRPRIYVGGLRLRYPLELLERSAMYVCGSYVAGGEFPQSCESDTVPQILGVLSRGAILREPQVLADLESAAVLAARLDATGWSVSGHQPSALVAIVRTVIGQRVALAPIEIVRGVFEEGQDRTWLQLAEDLIEVLRPNVVEIRAPEALLRTITEDVQAATLFPALGSFATEDLGVPLPPIRFVVDPTAQADTFTFKINSVSSVPWVSVRADSYAFAEEPSVLAEYGFNPALLPDPHGGVPYSVLRGEEANAARLRGYSGIGPLEHILLCSRVILRSNAHLMLDRGVVAQRVAALSEAFPALFDTASKLLDIDLLLAVCRALVAERISIRDLPMIVDRLLALSAADGWSGALDDAVTWVRAGMPRQILRRVGTAADRRLVTAYLLDPQLEDTAVRSHKALLSDPRDEQVDAELDTIVGAFARELGFLPARLAAPAVIASPDVREGLHDLLASELPRLHVIAVSELPAEVNVQPIARISTNA